MAVHPYLGSSTERCFFSQAMTMIMFKFRTVESEDIGYHREAMRQESLPRGISLRPLSCEWRDGSSM